MTLSAASVLAMERHFVGVLTAPSRLWLESAPQSQLAVAGGERVGRDGEACLVDFGVVESPGTEREVVRISSAVAAALRVADLAPWVAARWTPGNGQAVAGSAAELELVATHDVLEQTGFAGVVTLAARRASQGEQLEELRIRMTARRTHPLGAFDFHGSPDPRGFDFGVVDPLASPPVPYALSFRSMTSVPMTVRLADLPAWLTVDVGGRGRPGPAPGVFFERATPFTVNVRPHCTPEILGAHEGALRVETDDPRPAFRSFAIRFSVRLEPARPLLRAFPQTVHATTAKPLAVALRVENWGRTATRISPSSVPRSLKVLGSVAVPAAQRSAPGVAAVPMRLLPSQLSPGGHSLPLTFDVEGGAPLQIALPVQVAPAATRAASGRRGVAPAAIAALFALVVFTLIVALYLRVLS